MLSFCVRVVLLWKIDPIERQAILAIESVSAKLEIDNIGHRRAAQIDVLRMNGGDGGSWIESAAHNPTNLFLCIAGYGER